MGKPFAFFGLCVERTANAGKVIFVPWLARLGTSSRMSNVQMTKGASAAAHAAFLSARIFAILVRAAYCYRSTHRHGQVRLHYITQDAQMLIEVAGGQISLFSSTLNAVRSSKTRAIATSTPANHAVRKCARPHHGKSYGSATDYERSSPRAA